MRNTMIVALMALTAATGMFAQGPGPGVPGGRGRGGGGDRTPPTAAEMVDRRVQMLTTLLTLDANQQAQAKTIFTDENSAATALRTKMETAQDALQAAVKGGASDSQIDQLAASIGTLNGQGLAIHAKAQTKFRGILNSAQKEKLDTSRGGFGEGAGRPMRRPGGFPAQ